MPTPREVEDIARKSLSELSELVAPRPRSIPKLRPPAWVADAEQNRASAFYERLVRWIREFEETLDQEHEIGARLVSFGESFVFHLQGMGYQNPSLISFSGVAEDGEKVYLIQHVSQISILLKAMKRANPDEPKQPFGYHGIHGDRSQVNEQQQPAAE